MTATLDALRAAEILSPLDEHFARAIGRIAGETRPEVLLAAALVSRHVGNGHVCLDLSRLVEGAALVDDTGAPLPLHGMAGTRCVARDAAIESVGRRARRRDAAGARRRRPPVSAALLDAPGAAGGGDPGACGARSTQTWIAPGSRRSSTGSGRPIQVSARDLDWQRMAALLAVQRRFW